MAEHDRDPAGTTIRTTAHQAAGPARADGPGLYAELPDRIRPEDMITEQAAREPGDPTLGGRDSERDWFLRYGA